MHLSAERFEAPADSRDAGAVVKAAIRAADIVNTGARFAPFLLKVATAAHFDLIWGNENGDQHADFYRFKMPADARFLPLGDVALKDHGSLDQFGALLIASDDPTALAHPTGFTWLLNDHGSRQSTYINYWWPVAPEGYTALGLCFENGDASTPPKTGNYWCVRDDLLEETPGVESYWDDRNTHWSSNGKLRKPVLTSDMRPVNETVRIIPTTVLSAQGGQAGHVLLAKQCLLDLDAAYPDEPSYHPHDGAGSRSAETVLKIAVLPCTAVRDSGRPNQAKTSPFYYAASQGFWECQGSLSSPAGGSTTTSLHIGTASSVSKSFRESTSLTIGASVGFAAEGFSAGINTSYTRTFEYSDSTTDENSTDYWKATTINLPIASVVWLWQKSADVAVYNQNGMLVTSAIYGLNDHRIVAGPPKPGTEPAKDKRLAKAN